MLCNLSLKGENMVGSDVDRGYPAGDAEPGRFLLTEGII